MVFTVSGDIRRVCNKNFVRHYIIVIPSPLTVVIASVVLSLSTSLDITQTQYEWLYHYGIYSGMAS
jgi:hypothetical protein